MATRILKLLFLLVFSINYSLYAETENFSTSCYYDGFWGKWQGNGYSHILYGKYNDIMEVAKRAHPSDYYWRLKIYGLEDCNRHKRDRKNWAEYKGTLTYYISDQYPTLKQILKKGGGLAIYGNVIKRTVDVKVRVKPYKYNPEVYNIYFQSEGENCGFAISINSANALDW